MSLAALGIILTLLLLSTSSSLLSQQVLRQLAEAQQGLQEVDLAYALPTPRPAGSSYGTSSNIDNSQPITLTAIAPGKEPATHTAMPVPAVAWALAQAATASGVSMRQVCDYRPCRMLKANNRQQRLLRVGGCSCKRRHQRGDECGNGRFDQAGTAAGAAIPCAPNRALPLWFADSQCHARSWFAPWRMARYR